MAQPIPLPTADAEDGTTLPQNVEAEAALLGAMMIDNRVAEDVMQRIRPEHFYEPLHGRIFEQIVMLVGDNRLANPVTLRPLFAADEGLKQVGGTAYLAQLTANPASLIGAKAFADQIYDLAMLRALVTVGRDMVESALDTSEDINPSKQIEDAELRLYEVAEKGETEGGAKSFTRSAAMAVRNTERAMNSGGSVSGITTGFADLNAMMGGFNRSDLIILAARPAMGKSSLASNIAFNAAKRWMDDMEAGIAEDKTIGAPTAFFSLEMSADQLAGRILSEQSQIPSDKLRTGNINPSEFQRFARAAADLEKLPYFIDDTPGLTIAALRTRARRMKRQHKIGMIIVDYLQLLQGSGRHSGENRVQEISEISRGLKTLAKELDVPVVALSQLSRAVESREDKRPQLADLRESGSIEQDADIVLFIYREEYYHDFKMPRAPDGNSSADEITKYQAWQDEQLRVANKATVIVAKQRHGATGAVDLRFDRQYTKFSDMVPDGY
ncbi:replicative DNA helicase [Stakelama tenebrarum]|uniref:Replicative DNA helicase n=1 Tax=Stakelama tenebrarum TaxID=2711215 RepID=A0A6G6Y6X1_9SPHN|nr:replicative DNA helicase [Sphingosinithalassobacter tenebrarum]QIG80458.1 replicative DNA helicase [Sphingosinithalassobacter tenebrarum]